MSWNRINELRNRANEIIEEHLPLMWKDGDVRHLCHTVYDQITALMDEAFKLEHGCPVVWANQKKKLVYRGPFGEIELKRV